MLTASVLDFLRDLSKNNNREWFEANKKRYEMEVKKPFEQLIGAVIQAIQEVDVRVEVTPRQAMFRIHRDTRFSKDKSPYKTHIAAIIAPGGTRHKEYPGLYIHLESGMLMLGGGAYFLEKEPLCRVRQAIADEPERFNTLITAPDFVAKFGTIQGEKNKRLPPEFAEAARRQPLLYNKQFYYMAELEPQRALQESAVPLIMGYYHAAKPLQDFLAEALYA